MSSSKRLNTSDATRRGPKEALENPARSAPVGKDAAARPSSGKETGLPAAATTMKMTMTKTWMMLRPVNRSFRKP